MYIHDVMHKRASICTLTSWCLRVWVQEITVGEFWCMTLSICGGTLHAFFTHKLKVHAASDYYHSTDACVRLARVHTHKHTSLSNSWKTLARWLEWYSRVDINRCLRIFTMHSNLEESNSTHKGLQKKTILYISISCTRNCNKHVNKMITTVRYIDKEDYQGCRWWSCKKIIMRTSKEQESTITSLTKLLGFQMINRILCLILNGDYE